MLNVGNYSYIYSSRISLFSSCLEIEVIDISGTVECTLLLKAENQEHCIAIMCSMADMNEYNSFVLYLDSYNVRVRNNSWITGILEMSNK